MTAILSMGLPPYAAAVSSHGRGKTVCYALQVLAEQLRPTDPIGTLTLTLTNIVIGSRIRIETQSTGALVEDRVADTTTEVFTVPVYASGSAGNDLRIKVRKATTGTAYIPWETLATAAPGAQSIYVAQISDE